jgi:hypothetical protein
VSSPRLEPLGVQIDLIGRTVQLRYNVRYDVGEDDIILAAGAEAKMTLTDKRWEDLQTAIDRAVDDLRNSLGLSPQSDDLEEETPLGGDWVNEDPEQEL